MEDRYFTHPPFVHSVTTNDGRSVILDLQRDQYLGLDQVGTTIWTLLTSGTSLFDTLRFLKMQYADASDDQIKSDLFAFIQNMQSLSLLVEDHLCDQNDMLHRREPRFSLDVWVGQLFSLLAVRGFSFRSLEWLESWIFLRLINIHLRQNGLMFLIYESSRRFAVGSAEGDCPVTFEFNGDAV